MGSSKRKPFTAEHLAIARRVARVVQQAYRTPAPRKPRTLVQRVQVLEDRAAVHLTLVEGMSYALANVARAFYDMEQARAKRGRRRKLARKGGARRLKRPRRPGVL